MNFRIRILLISICFLFVACKNGTVWRKLTGQSSNASSAANSSNDQCYPPGQGAGLKLADGSGETFTAPTISTMSVSSSFPYNLTYSSDQVYDHAVISVCADDNTCQQMYSTTDSKIIFPSKKGVTIVKLQLCFNTACSDVKSTQFINQTVMTSDQKAIADRLQVLDTNLLSLAQQRLQLDSNTSLTPYVFLRTFEELYLNQPNRLELANQQCSYVSAYVDPNTSTQGDTVMFGSVQTYSPNTDSNVEVSSGTGTQVAVSSGTGTGTSTATQTTTSMFKTISQYLGIAGSVLSFVMLGRDVYKTYTINRDLIKKDDMFLKIRKVLTDPAVGLEMQVGEYSSLRTGLGNIQKEYSSYFSKDSDSMKLLEEVQNTDEKMKKLDGELEKIDADTKLTDAQKNEKTMEVVNAKNGQRIAPEKFTQFEEKKPPIPPESKSALNGYAGGIGKFLAKAAVSAGFLAYGYNLSGGTDQSLKTFDSEIYIALEERNSLLEVL